jgi:nucleoside-diphosphate-sugar epimerase
MTVLVTGASGFVGCHIVDALARLDPDRVIVAADRVSPDEVARAVHLAHPLTVRPIMLDVTDRDAVRTIVAAVRPTAIVHAAAITPSPEQEREAPMRIVDVNLGGLTNVIAAAGEAGSVQRFIFLSSTGVFGPDAAPRIDEDEDPRPVHLYGITKRAGEDIVRRWGEVTGISTASVRLGSIFGRFERPTPSRARLSAMARLIQAGSVHRVAKVHGREVERDWLAGDDLGAAVHTMLAAPSLGHSLYHVVGQHLRWDAVVEIAAQAGIRSDWVDNPLDADVSLQSHEIRIELSTRRFTEEFGEVVRTPMVDAIASIIEWQQRQVAA